MTMVVNIRKKRGQVRPKCDVIIDRRSIFGNPYQIGIDGDREQVLRKYHAYFYNRLTKKDFRDKVLELKGKTLGCWCKPLSCHGDVIVDYLENRTSNPF